MHGHGRACGVPEIAFGDPCQQLFSMGLQRHTPILAGMLVDEVGLLFVVCQLKI